MGVGHRLQCVFTDADHDGNAHERQQHCAVEHIDADGNVEGVDDDWRHHGQTDETPDDTGNCGQQFDDNFERFLNLTGTEFGNEHGGPEPERHRNDHGEGGHTQRADDQSPDSILGLGLGSRKPLG